MVICLHYPNVTVVSQTFCGADFFIVLPIQYSLQLRLNFKYFI
jgi:hypothetical protein